MCYRFTLTTPAKELAGLFDVELPFELAPRNNIALTTPIAGVRLNAAGNRELSLMRFGLIPRWTKEEKPAGFGNARSETVAEKPAFRDAFKKRRCLIPADCFYEWEHVGKVKIPWQFAMKDGRPFAFAGIWESWTNSEGSVVESAAILTTTPNGLLQPIHDRMPVILARESHDRWLKTDDIASLTDVFAPFNAELMMGERVEDDRFRRK